MEVFYNKLGQPMGRPMPDWAPPPFPPRQVMAGRTCLLEPLTPERHTEDLFEAFSHDTEGALWTYLPVGPFESVDTMRAWIISTCTKNDPQFYAIINRATNRCVGVASFMRIDPSNGCIEVGHLAFSPALQRTTASTEAMYLMMKRAFDLGYRRYEWKCNALNQPSRAAAERLGFTFEGIFRQAIIAKGRNRDTAWYSIIDGEWPGLCAALEAWLAPENFGPDGEQLTRLQVQCQPAEL